MAEMNPWEVGRPLVWKDDSSSVIQERQVVVLDRAGAILWFWDHKAAMFTGVKVKGQELRVEGPSDAVQRMIAEAGLEATLKTPGKVIRSFERQPRWRTAPSKTAPLRELAHASSHG